MYPFYAIKKIGTIPTDSCVPIAVSFHEREVFLLLKLPAVSGGGSSAAVWLVGVRSVYTKLKVLLKLIKVHSLK